MPSEFVIRQNDTEPEIRSTLRDSSGAAVNLTTATSVRFKVRPLAGGTLKVDAPATVSDAPTGSVYYQWQAANTDTIGLYIAEWFVTWADGGLETFPNDERLLVRVTSPSLAAVSPDYVTLEEMKQTLKLEAPAYADQDLTLAITAASRAVDHLTGRTFAPAVSATPRVYNPDSWQWLFVDDFYDSPSLVVTRSSVTQTLGTDFLLHPAYPATGWPYEALRAYKKHWPIEMQAITVTAKWGWPAVPEEIKEATKILVARLFRRPREAAFGVASFGIDSGGAYVARTDPDVEALVKPYRKLRVAG